MQSWDDEQAKGQKRKAEDINQSNDTKYWMDYRNPEHAQLSWTACSHDHCTIHYSDKAGAGWYPKKVKGSPKCKWQWFDCTNDQCAKHLWDKRITLYYPGHDDPQEIMQMQIVELKDYDNGEAWECEQPTWHTCLSPDCDLHAIVKNFHGFGCDSFFRPTTGSREPKEINSVNATSLIKLSVQLNGHWIHGYSSLIFGQLYEEAKPAAGPTGSVQRLYRERTSKQAWPLRASFPGIFLGECLQDYWN
jgi:hypothetical protein